MADAQLYVSEWPELRWRGIEFSTGFRLAAALEFSIGFTLARHGVLHWIQTGGNIEFSIEFRLAATLNSALDSDWQQH